MSEKCPSLVELLSGEPEVLEHANGCERCQAILAFSGEVGEPAGGEMASFEPAPLPRREARAERAVGEVVALRGGEDEDELLVAAILAVLENGGLQVAPLSGAVEAAGEWDLLLGAEDGPLGYPAIAEVWNHGQVAPGQLAESFGVLAASAAEQLLTLYTAAFAAEHPAGLNSGAAIVSERDPRFGFQESEARRAQIFWSGGEEAEVGAEANEAVSEIEGFGARVSRWLEETGADPANVATDLGWSAPDLDRVLCEDIRPLQGGHSAEHLSELLALTDIEGEEAEELLPRSVHWGEFPAEEAPQGELVFRRAAPGVERRLQGRRGGGGEEAAEPTPAQRRALEVYVREIVELAEERRS